MHLLLRREPRLLGSESHLSLLHYHQAAPAAVPAAQPSPPPPPLAAALSRCCSLSRLPLPLARGDLAVPAEPLPRVQQLVLSPAYAVSPLQGHPVV